MMEFVSWDDDISNIWKHILNVPNHQPVSQFTQVLTMAQKKQQLAELEDQFDSFLQH